MVRPSWLISGGHDWSPRSSVSWRVYWSADGWAVDPVDVSDGFGGVSGCADFPVGVTSVEETTRAGLALVADPLMRRR